MYSTVQLQQQQQQMELELVRSPKIVNINVLWQSKCSIYAAVCCSTIALKMNRMLNARKQWLYSPCIDNIGKYTLYVCQWRYLYKVHETRTQFFSYFVHFWSFICCLWLLSFSFSVFACVKIFSVHTKWFEPFPFWCSGCNVWILFSLSLSHPFHLPVFLNNFVRKDLGF